MNVERKILKLEQAILGRGGLPAWAIEAAERTIRTRKIAESSIDCLQAALMKADASYKPKHREQPHPISDSMDATEFAGDLVQRFKVRQHFEEWQRLRYDAGALRLKKFIKDMAEVHNEDSSRT